MPHMLGWYLLGEQTTMAEMEWMLARAAGYHAGFAMVARPKALRSNPRTPQLLDAIREWEEARTTNAFTLAQREALKNPKDEFHLEKIAAGKWNLYQYSLSPLLLREKFERQPGEPTHTTWTFNQSAHEQPMQFRLFINGKSGGIKNIKMQVDNYAEISIPIELGAGESIVCDGTQEVRIYDVQKKKKRSYTLASQVPVVTPGNHTIVFDCSFEEGDSVKVEMQVKALGRVEAVASTQ